MLARAQMADRACVLYLLIFLGIPYKSIGNLTSGYSKLHYGFRLDRPMIDSFVEYSILDCVGECLRTTRCYSLNYYKGANYCELNYENKTSVPGKFVENEGWIYSERQDWDKELAGPCSSKVCEINEKCIQIGCNTSCQILDCGIPFTSRMSSDVVERWDGIGVERRIHVKCSNEYQQNGSGIFICNKNGKWNSDMSCNEDTSLSGSCSRDTAVTHKAKHSVRDSERCKDKRESKSLNIASSKSVSAI
ncbi:uncharacterized protein LOC134260374 [Saccostrea cucullata]|uniref:uncharacterized protein LOC134260374 n=1 Tax=Saccostrea cuccullata TaxID=36930 RepID=UPI002ED683B2